MANVNLRHNFTHQKAKFKTDTGLDADKNTEQYIAYIAAVSSDMQTQLVAGIFQELNEHSEHLKNINANLASMCKLLNEIKMKVK